jgi:hypothetical protein
LLRIKKLEKKPTPEKRKSSQSNVPVKNHLWSSSTITPDEKGINSHKVIFPFHRIKIIDVKEYTHNPSGNEKYTQDGNQYFKGAKYSRKNEIWLLIPIDSNQLNILKDFARKTTYNNPPKVNGLIT